MNRVFVTGLGLVLALAGCAAGEGKTATSANGPQVRSDGAARPDESAPDLEDPQAVPVPRGSEEGMDVPAANVSAQPVAATPVATEADVAAPVAPAAPVEDGMAGQEATPQTTYPQAGQATTSYHVTVVDQDGKPVPDVLLVFGAGAESVEVRCAPDGTALFEGPGQVYHVQVIDAPFGYTWSQESDAYTDSMGGDVLVRISRD